jgi:hypothetical protein
MAFQAKMKTGTQVYWRIAPEDEILKGLEGDELAKKGEVILEREPGDTWPKPMDDFKRQYEILTEPSGNTRGTAKSKPDNWREFKLDTVGGKNKRITWGPNTHYINTEGKPWPRRRREFDMYYERKPEVHSMGTKYDSFTAPKK